MNDCAQTGLVKKELRKRVAQRLKSLGLEVRARAAVDVCNRLAHTPEWRAAKAILGFAPMNDEINIWPLLIQAIVQGRDVALPRYDSYLAQYAACYVRRVEDLVSGRYGIQEPGQDCAVVGTKLLDLILVPGVAFDLKGRRLGRGKGFYDRFLQTWRGVTCGVAYDEQIVDEVPVEAHDVQLDCILTPTRFVRARGL